MSDDSAKDEAAKAVRQLAGSFEITLNLSDRRGIKINGYVYSDDTPADINGRLDAMQDALDRQAIRADIVNKQAQIEGHRANLVALKDAYEGLADKKRAQKKLNSSEIQGIANYPRQVKMATEMIESLEAAIAAAKTKLGMA